jgi:hypothetical protein
MTDIEKKILKIKGGLLSYTYVYEPRPQAGGKPPRFEASVLLDPSNAEHAAKILELKNEAARIAKDYHGDKVQLSKLKMPWGIVAEDAPYCAGWFFLQMWSKDRPVVVNRANEPTVSESDPQAVFAGATVNTNPTFFGWKFTEKETGMTKIGISANLRTLQYVSGDPNKDRFGGRSAVNVDDEFEAIGDAAGKAGDTPAVDPFA